MARRKKRRKRIGRSAQDPCPCGSGEVYGACCQPYHQGAAEAPTPEALMRSRYSAYALNLPAYIIRTTHPDSDHIEEDRAAWAKGIMAFSSSITFAGLTILETETDGEVRWVTFEADLRQSGQPVPMRERSRFEKVEGVWRYIAAEEVS